MLAEAIQPYSDRELLLAFHSIRALGLYDLRSLICRKCGGYE